MEGRKIWEIRCGPCRLDERVGLIQSGSGLIVGKVDVKGCKGPLSDDELRANYSKHLVPMEKIREIRQRCKRKELYAWVLANPKKFSKPVPYEHRQGMRIWVRVPDIPG